MNLELSEEDQMFRDMTRKWVDKEFPKDWCRDLGSREKEFPDEFWAKLVAYGAHGIGIAEEYGGQGGSIVTQALFARELSRTAAGLAWIWGVTSFSGSKAIEFCGSEEQKRLFLPKIATGELKTAMSYSEPGGGTDLLGGMKTSATKTDGGWIINGEKIWSTLANVADYLLLMARSDKDVAKRSDGVSIFFVPTNSEGISMTEMPKLGMRAVSSCSVHLENVFVPDDLLLGEEGKGWYQSTKTLNNERLINAATCLGMLDWVIEDAVEHMKTLHAFGTPIGPSHVQHHYLAGIARWQKQARVPVPYTAALPPPSRPRRPSPCRVQHY